MLCYRHLWCEPDHPREYGENWHVPLTSTSQTGPSPRIRGELANLIKSVVDTGTIPANTGRIFDLTKGQAVTRDHPREYGENDTEPGEFNIVTWTIPANTGRIWSTSMSVVAMRDHPREYGENHVRNQRINPITGTIPANTGRICRRAERYEDCRDHPREYGENLPRKSPPKFLLGPSPRIRGESEEYGNQLAGLGTIPANTGRIALTLAAKDAMRDHPREYGENQLSHRRGGRRAGPSPRIRGELADVPVPRPCARDHPREYGENRASRVNTSQ